MNLICIIKELIHKFSKNKNGEYQVFWGYFWIIIVPVLMSIISIIIRGPESIFEFNFSQVYISVISIFAAFYISLLVYINQKTNELNTKIISDQTEKNNSIRTVNNSRKLTIYLLYSLVWIIISITLILVTSLNLSTNNSLIIKILALNGGFIQYFALYSFIILLFKILHNSQTSFIKDITNKAKEITNKDF